MSSRSCTRRCGFGSAVTLESAGYLLRFSPEKVVYRIAPRDLLIVHGVQNKLHKPVEVESLYEHAAEPKRLEILEGRGHTEWMFDEDPDLQACGGNHRRLPGPRPGPIVHRRPAVPCGAVTAPGGIERRRWL